MKALMKKLEALLEKGGMKKDIALLAVSGAALLMSIFRPFPMPVDPAWAAIVLCGVPIVLEAMIGLITAFDIKADVLVSLALIASVCIGETFAAGEVAFIMQLGALLEEMTVARARAGIERLVRLTPQTARVLGEEGERVVPAEQVRIGDRLRVLPGETIPVDGVIVSGQTSVKQAVMTGESLPVDKSVGDEVASGMVNQFGAFEMRAAKVGEDSSIQRMIRLVQSADAGKAKIVGLADRWATWIVVTAIMAAIGNATKHGFLVREGDALERLAAVREVAFDKTGTLTWGKPEVIAIEAAGGFDEETVYRLAASAEVLSEHPLGKAVVRCYRAKRGQEPAQPDSFAMLPGRGVEAAIESRAVLAGNAAFLAGRGVEIPQTLSRAADGYLARGATAIYLAVDGRAAGLLALADTLRPESAAMIAALKATGVTPLLLTGDGERAAKTIAAKLEIDEVCSGCLPEDKLRRITADQEKGVRVCMIGDGVNDAPALKRADVGVAMGGVGSDIAVDAADIALVDDKVEELPHLLALSRRMMKTIKLNLVFSMTLNFLAIALAITGVLNPVVGALVHNAGSVLVIGNSALLLKWRKRK